MAAYFPPTGSTVAFQSQPSSLMVGASIIGLVPISSKTDVTVIQADPSQLIATVSIVSINFNNSSLVTKLTNSSVAALQGTNPWLVNDVGSVLVALKSTAASVITTPGTATYVTSLVSTVPSSVMVGASVFGTVPVTQVTAPWAISTNTPSYLSIQPGGSIMAVRTDNASVITVSQNSSVAVLQGTNPWVMNVPTPSYIAYQLAGSIMQVTGGGGGTQYQENNAVTPSVTGNAILYKKDETNSVLSTVSPQHPLPVQGSISALQGTNPWVVNMPSPSVVIITPAGSVQAVRTDNASVIAVLTNSSVAALQGTNPWVISNPSVTAFQGGAWAISVVGGPLNINSILGTYQEKNAVTPSAIGIPTLFKIDETNSVLSAVSPQSPFPIRGSVAALQGTNPWVVSVPTPSYLSIQPGGSVINANISGSVAAAITNFTASVAANINVISASIIANQGTSPWVIQSIVGTFSEDAAHTTADKGIFTLMVRNDTMSSITSTDLDYSPHIVGPVGETIIANAPITKWVNGFTSVMSGTSVQVLAAPGTSIFTYITGIYVTNEASVAGRVTITQGLGAVASSIVTVLIAPGFGGSNNTYLNPLRVLDNLGISASINAAPSVYVTITGFTAKT